MHRQHHCLPQRKERLERILTAEARRSAGGGAGRCVASPAGAARWPELPRLKMKMAASSTLGLAGQLLLPEEAHSVSGACCQLERSCGFYLQILAHRLGSYRN